MASNSLSKTVVTYPITTALVKAEQFLGANRTWQPVNALQARFLTEIFEPCRAESAQLPDIESIASRDADEINTFLRQRGFRIELKPFDPSSFGVACILDLMVEWLRAGEETRVQDLAGNPERLLPV